MAPKGNAKAVAAREAKAGREADKKAKDNAAKDAAEAADWDKGSKKDKGQDAKAKAAEAKAAKAARDAALAAEEASISSKPKQPAKAGSKVPAKKPTPITSSGATPAGGRSAESSTPGTPKRGAGGAGDIPDFDAVMNAPIESFSATNIDDALDLLSLVNEKQDKASVGSRAAQLDSHPERRYKAALAAYKERELPILRKDRPGLRLQQYEEILYKDFKKSPENPFNQVNVAFDASKEEKVEALKKLREDTERRLRND